MLWNEIKANSLESGIASVSGVTLFNKVTILKLPHFGGMPH